MEKLLTSILDIYSAPGHINGWINALETTSQLTGSEASVYVLINNETLENEMSAWYGFPDDSIDLYQGVKGAYKDVRFKYMHKLVPGEVYREFEFVPDKCEYDESEWIKYQLNELGVYYCIAAKVSTSGAWTDIISLNRLKSKGQHMDEDKQHLQMLLPHYSRASELHRLFTNLSRRYGLVLSVLDKLLIGLIILDKHQRVVNANETARKISDISGLFRFTKSGKLKANEKNTDLALQTLLLSSSKTASAEGDSNGGDVILKGPIENESVLLEIVPLRDDNLPDKDNIQGSAVFVISPSQAQYFSASGLSKIFNLTSAEYEVVNALIGGMAVNEIADHRHTSPETVRWQLKSVFSKTGSNSQLDLLRLASKVTTPIKKEKQVNKY